MGAPNHSHDSACSIALLVPLASDRSEASYYAEEAVTVLSQAVSAGWTKAVHTATDPDLTPLHDHEEFRRLLARMFDRGFPADPFARDKKLTRALQEIQVADSLYAHTEPKRERDRNGNRNGDVASIAMSTPDQRFRKQV